MGRVKAGGLRLREAAELLELSYRQAKRIWARYGVGGAQALQHGNCGRRSNRAYPMKWRAACNRGRPAMQISDLRWRPSIWPVTTGSKCMPRRCGVGCVRPGCGRDNGGASGIVSGGEAKAPTGEKGSLAGGFIRRV